MAQVGVAYLSNYSHSQLTGFEPKLWIIAQTMVACLSHLLLTLTVTADLNPAYTESI